MNKSIKNTLLSTVFALSFLAGCIADLPEDVAPALVAGDEYQAMSCDLLEEAFDEESRTFHDHWRAQRDEREKDAITANILAATFFLAPLAVIVNEEENQEKLAQSKGRINAIADVARKNNCERLIDRVNLLEIRTR